MSLLVFMELRRLDKRNRQDADTTPIEFGFMGTHLAEMSLARKSGEMTKKNQQKIIVEIMTKGNSLPGGITKIESADHWRLH